MTNEMHGDARDRAGLATSLGVGAAVALVWLAYFLSHDRPWALHGENTVDIFPGMFDAFRQWAAGHLPVWTNGTWGGYPTVANPQAGTFYPIHALYLWLTPFPHLRAFDLGTALHAAVLASGACLFLGRLGCGRLAAGFGGVLSALAPTVLSTTLFLPAFAAVSWLPWVLVVADELVQADRTPRVVARQVVLGSMVLAAQAFAGYPEWALYSGCAAAFWILFAPSKLGLLQRAGRLAALGAAAVLLAAPQLLTTASEVPDTQRRKVAWSYAVPATVMKSPLGFVDPRPAEPAVSSPYLGAATLVLAGIAVGLRAGTATTLALLALVTLILSLGKQTPAYDWFHAIPPFGIFRGPAKFFVLTQLSVMWLAALGVETLRSRAGGNGRRVWAWAAVVLAGVSLAGYVGQLRHRLPEIEGSRYHREPELPRDVELLAPVAHLLTEAGREGRPPPRTFVAEYHTVVGNLGMLFGMEDLRGGVPPLMGRRAHKILHRFKSPDGERLGWMTRRHLDLYGVERVLQMKPCHAPPWRDLDVISPPGSPVCVMDNPTARARYELVTAFEAFETDEAMIDRMRDVEPPRKIPILGSPDLLPPHTPGALLGSVHVTDYWPGRIDLEVDAVRDAMLLVRETYKEGWQAEVDGERVGIVPAFGLYQALPIAAGEHRVRLRYRPPGLRTGLAMMGVWAVIAGAVLWWGRSEPAERRAPVDAR